MVLVSFPVGVVTIIGGKKSTKWDWLMFSNICGLMYCLCEERVSDVCDEIN